MVELTWKIYFLTLVAIDVVISEVSVTVKSDNPSYNKIGADVILEFEVRSGQPSYNETKIQVDTSNANDGGFKPLVTINFQNNQPNIDSNLHPNFKDRVVVQFVDTVLRVTIKNSEAQDYNRDYQCTASTSQFNEQFKSMELKLAVPPRIVQSSLFTEGENKVTMEIGSKSQWKCEADQCTPTPDVEWIKLSTKGNEIVHRYGKAKLFSILTIDSISASDRGAYRCVAENVGGVDKATFYLEPGYIQFEPTNVTTHEIIYRRIGESIMYNCPIKGYPLPTFEWKRSNNATTYETNKQLVRVIKDDSFFTNYTCKATNRFGSKIIVLTVLDVPTSQKFNSSSRLYYTSVMLITCLHIFLMVIL